MDAIYSFDASRNKKKSDSTRSYGSIVLCRVANSISQSDGKKMVLSRRNCSADDLNVIFN